MVFFYPFEASSFCDNRVLNNGLLLTVRFLIPSLLDLPLSVGGDQSAHLPIIYDVCNFASHRQADCPTKRAAHPTGDYISWL
jgi:hypothetical protein